MEKTFVSNRLRPLIKLFSGRLFSLSLILFSLIICSAVQFFFPLHILTHEFTQFFTIAAFIFFYFVLFRTVKGKGIHQPQCDESLEALKFHAFKGIILLVLITIGLMYLYNKLFWNCHYHPGIPFFLITVVPSLYLASVLGIIAGLFRLKWITAIGLLAILVMISIGQDLLQLINGAFIADLFIGAPLAFNQRLSMNTAIPNIHLSQRFFILLIAHCFWYLGLIFHLKKFKPGEINFAPGYLRGIRQKAFLFTSMALFILIPFGSDVGFGWSNARQERELSCTASSTHFRFHYRSGSFAEANLASIKKNAEWYLDRLIGHWKTKPTNKIDVYISNRLMELTGINASHAIAGKIYITPYDTFSTTFYHELVHAVHQEMLSPAKVVWLNRGIIEGMAQAYEKEMVFSIAPHRPFAAALASGKLPSAVEFMDILGFWKLNENLAYRASGSFIGFLIQRFGIEKFKKFQKNLRYEDAFGADLSDLDRQWRHFLKEIRLDMKSRIIGEDQFDSHFYPAYTASCCPKLGSSNHSPSDRAMAFLKMGYNRLASKLFINLYQSSGKFQWGFQAALCLEKASDYSASERLLENLNNLNLTVAQRLKWLKLKLKLSINIKNWSEIEKMFKQLFAYDFNRDNRYLAMLRNLLSDQTLRKQIAEILAEKNVSLRLLLLSQLHQRYSDNHSLRNLYALKGIPPLRRIWFRPFNTAEMTQIRNIITLLRLSPEILDSRAAELLFYMRAADFFDFPSLARDIATLLRDRSQDERYRYTATLALKKLSFR